MLLLIKVTCLSGHSYWRVFAYLYSRLWFWINPVPDLLCGHTSGSFRESRVRSPPPRVPHPPLPAFSTPLLLLSLDVGQQLQRCAQKRERSRSGVDGCQRAGEEQRRKEENKKKTFLLGHLWSKCVSGERGTETKRLSQGGKGGENSLQALRAWDEEKRREEKIGEETTRSKYGEREFKRILIQVSHFCNQPNQFEGVSFKWILRSRGVCVAAPVHIPVHFHGL